MGLYKSVEKAHENLFTSKNIHNRKISGNRQLTACSIFLFEKLIVSQQVKKYFLASLQHDNSLPRSQNHPHVPVRSQINLRVHVIHVIPSYFLSIHLNIILPSTLASSKWFLSLKFPHQTLNGSILPKLRATRHAPYITLYFVNRIVISKKIKVMDIVMLKLFEHICHRPKYTPQALFLNAFCLCKMVQTWTGTEDSRSLRLPDFKTIYT